MPSHTIQQARWTSAYTFTVTGDSKEAELVITLTSGQSGHTAVIATAVACDMDLEVVYHRPSETAILTKAVEDLIKMLIQVWSGQDDSPALTQALENYREGYRA